MIDRNSIVKDWYVIFEDQGKVSVWGMFAPGARFTHCELVGRDSERWITVRPINAGVKLVTTQIPASHNVTDLFEETEAMAMVKAPRFKKKKPRVILFAPWTCVEVCKATLGCGCWYVVTPDQLYQYISMGGNPPAKWKVKNIAFGFCAHIMAVIYTLMKLVKRA